jgi:hypothetical protein
VRLLELASLLSAEVNCWAALLQGLDTEDGLSATDLDSVALRGEDGEPLVTTGYAVIRLLEAAGKLDDLLVSIGHLWPGRKEWTEAERSRHSPSEQVPWLARLHGTDLEFAYPIATRLMQELGDTGELSGWEADYEALVSRRSAWAAACAAGHFTETVPQALFTHLVLIENASPVRRPDPDREIDVRRLTSAVRTYVRVEGLFTWMAYQDYFDREQAPRWNPYHLLFQTAKSRGIFPVISVEEVEAIIGREFGREVLSDIMRIVGRLQEAIGGGGYEQVLDTVSEDDALFGAGSIISSHEPVNIIPGSTVGSYQRTLIAFSVGKKRGKVEPIPATLRKIREHLIRCSQRTKIVILITDNWNPDAFTESRGDLVAHREHGVVFLPLLVNGNRLVPMAPPI